MPGLHPEEEVATADSPQGDLGRSRPLAEGAQFASYVITGLLGSGGLARVYRARHQTLGHEVALKVFEPAAAPGPSGVASFLREAHLAASVRHPHVVQTQDGGVHEGLPFLVMELLEGRDLEAHLRGEGPLEELALIELAIPIVAALMALHAQGLVHGDLGPGNIFLGRAQQGPAVAKLLDIGISKPHRRLRLTAAARQRLMGSPLYMAPEAMLGHAPTPASDQYSLGLILYEAVTGVNPFISSSLKESVRLIIAGQRLAVSEQSVAPSPGLATIIERALSIDPAERFPDLASLGRALLRLADQRTRAAWEFSFHSEPAVSAAAAARGMPTLKQRAPTGWGVAAVGLAVLGWVTAGVVTISSTRSDPQQAYVMLGPNPSVESMTRQLQPRPPSGTASLAAPCRDGSSAEVASGQAATRGQVGQEPPLDGVVAPAALIEVGAPGEESAGDVSSFLSNDEAGAAAPGGPLELGPAAGEPALDPPQSAPVEGSPGGGGIPLPARGTNNAPIFD